MSDGKSDKMLPNSFEMVKILGLGVSVTIRIPFTVRLVLVSISLRFARSIKSSYLAMKSAPIIGLFTEASMNGCLNDRRSPKLTSKSLVPYVSITDPLAAPKTKSDLRVTLPKNE